MSQIEKRIEVNRIIENQLPEFVVSDFPKAAEFLKQYYISQEYQGGPIDLTTNLDRYLKVDNLVPEVITGSTILTADITSSETGIGVSSTKGFPSEYGLLKIGDEIITYTGITTNSFTGCVRGFSGVTGYNVGVTSSLIEVNNQKLVFEDTSASSHKEDATVTNLSVLFLQEFYRKTKRTFLPGLEDNEFHSDIDVGNFVKFARSFYQSKGIEESLKILFKVLYGINPKVTDLEERLIKPSSAEYIRREVVVAENVSIYDPLKLVGQTIFKSTDNSTNASISEVEILSREGKTYYKLSLFVGFDDKDLIEGVFTIPGKTKILEPVSVGFSTITVDSTVGFGTTGTVVSGNNTINYTSKSINQFFGCTGVNNNISTADDIRSEEVIFGFEDGDLAKKVELRITGVISDFVPVSNVNLIKEGEKIYVKNVGEKIDNPTINKSYKEIFANSWIYNTSSRYFVKEINSGRFVLNSKIDRSSLKLGDSFAVVKRGSQTNEVIFTVDNIDLNTNSVGPSGLSGWTPIVNQHYDIRRVVNKATSSGIELTEGNNSILSDVLNVYNDSSAEGYVASNSLPSYDVQKNIIKETLSSSNTDINDSDFALRESNALGQYGLIAFDLPANTNLKFVQGDAVIYNAGISTLSMAGLQEGRLYYVDVLPAEPNSGIHSIRLYNSRAEIGGFDTNIKVGVSTIALTTHTFTLADHHNKKLGSNKILRKFPLSQNLYKVKNNERPTNNIGLLIDGVQIHSPLSDDIIYYGPLNSVEVFNEGIGYDVVNPPKVVVENSTGTTALVDPILSGTVKEVLVDPQDFDIEKVNSISLTGGNGSGCFLEPILGPRFRELEFDSRDVFFNGGVSIAEETITFTGLHNLEDGEVIYYNSNGNAAIGIGAAYDLTNTIIGTLADGAPYFVRVVNSRTIRLFNKVSDALVGTAGINTVGLSTDTSASGIHKFRTESKNTLRSINVIESGSGYQYRNLRVEPSGISTAFDTINYKNHGFNEGDIVEYSSTNTTISGLTTTNSYKIVKIDNNSFKLANAGVGGTSTFDYDRSKCVNLNSTGTGYQKFKYPDIKVNVDVSYGSTVTGTFNFTPIITGQIIDSYLYEKGTDYGSTILNHQKNPDVTIQTGKDAAVKCLVVDGKIGSVTVTNKGEQYFSAPELEIEGDGSGAILRPIIENGQLSDVIIINAGIGYSTANTNAFVKSRGRNGYLESRVRNLTLNNIRDNELDNDYLDSTGSEFSYNIIGYDQDLADHFSESFEKDTNTGEFLNVTDHSPIIGWAYDGNPIYGPFGYENPDDINSIVRILDTGYTLSSSQVENRPTGFDAGRFVEDYVYDDSGQLDIHNGRFCKTPEFPNGIYAYFAGVTTSTSSNKLISKFPYFIGNTYKFPLINDNLILDQDFDFNSSNLLRNTQPYKVGEEFAENDFIIESNESIRQFSVVESIHSGEIKNLNILDGGSGYKIGDFTDFDDSETGGIGFQAQVDEIVGIGVSKIETVLTRFENSVFEWKDNREVIAHHLPFIELNDQDNVVISGLSTNIVNLTDSFKVGVKTDTIGLAKTMAVNNNAAGVIEDIYVNQIPDTVSIGGSIRIGSEAAKVLTLFDVNKVIRIRRFNTGIAHTYGSNIDVLNNKISIPVRTERFNSKPNDIVFFNSTQQVGVGVTSGSAITRDYHIGETKIEVPIPTRTIYLPNHPFITGQAVRFAMNPGATPFTARGGEHSTTFNLPDATTSFSDVFVINKGENYIGLVTQRSSIGSTSEGVFFNGGGSSSGISSGLYSITSKFDQVIGDIDRITSTVTTNVSAADTTTHGLAINDVVKMNVKPNLSVGFGNSSPISVKYNSQFEKLLFNEVEFAAADVETNRIDISGHGFKTGDKVFYDGNANGLETGSYFVYEVSDRYFQLGETFKDVTVNPPRILPITASTGGSGQKISLINPQINVVKNSKVTFGLSDTSLSGFDFRIYYDDAFKSEYNSSQDTNNFNVTQYGVVGLGTSPSDPIGAAVTISYSNESPNVLYYSLTKGGYISTSDKQVINGSEIKYIDSAYSGEFKVFDITNDTFKISPRRTPEFLTYEERDCDVIEYSTRSKNVVGSIKDLKITSKGFNYKVLPGFTSVTSVRGKNANIVAISTTIGSVKDARIVDIGYEYSSDKTLSPEAFISPTVNVDNLDVIESVNVISGGKEYTSPPDLLLFDPIDNKIVDNSSLIAKVPNQTIAEVELFVPIQGLDSISHNIIAINNSNGVGIRSMQSSSSGLVTCFLDTPLNGYFTAPFTTGDKIFVEGIQREGESGTTVVGVGTTGGQGGIGTSTNIIGDGFNSENYNYRFFDVIEYSNSNPAVLKFSVAGLTTNPGVAKTFQSGYASLINKNNYPVLEPVQVRGKFQLSEQVRVDSGNGYIDTDLIIVEVRDDYVKVDGDYRLNNGDRIKGIVSNVSAEVVGIIKKEAKFKIDYSSKQNVGWTDGIGKLNEDYQVIPDNDYFQNLSYTVESPIEWEKSVDPVNRLVHPAGLKNFADTIIESVSESKISYGSTTVNAITLDIVNDPKRVDAINVFDLATDFDRRDNQSKFAQVSNKQLTDFTKCKSNRVLIHDDISSKFSSKGFQASTTELEELDSTFSHYLVQIIDPDTFDTQVSELIVLTDTNNAYLLEKSTDFTTTKLGDFTAESNPIDQTKTINFFPTEVFTKDHDIKLLKTDFRTDQVSAASTNEIGQVELSSTIVGVGSTTVGFTTTTIVEYPKTDFNALHASLIIQNDLTKDVNYSEVIVDFDGVNTYIAETFIDTRQNSSTTNKVGLVTAVFEDNRIRLQCLNDQATTLTVSANVVGLGTTTAGIGTHRFAVPGQEPGSERSARLHSDYSSGTGAYTFATLDKNLDSTIKSLVRVSCGETSAIHQLIGMRDIDDVLTVQYPFVSAGSTTGIGTFGGEISGSNINIKFYPDTEYSSALTEVQSFNQVLYTTNDFDNTAPVYQFGEAEKRIFLSAYDGLNGNRSNKTEFDLTHENTPIYTKTFDPTNTGILSTTTGIFTIDNHFYNNGEQLEYTPSSTIIGLAATAVSIASTANSAGVVTTILPTTVFPKVINERQFQLFTRKEYVTASGALPVTFTGTGSGNAHKLNITKKLSKTVIGLDGIVQQPISFTSIEHTLDGAIGIGITQFILSGISSVQPKDVLKIDNEYMKVDQVGFASVQNGFINDSTAVSLGIATLPVVRVQRGSLGIGATPHSDGAAVRVHRGSFNIVDSKVFFLDPPKGNTRSRRADDNLPFVKAEFSGRTFLRSDYTTNMVFDDISDVFTGIGRTYSLTVGGANTSTGVGIGNGVLFINGVFQTPLTVNNTGNNYEFENDTTAGISSVVFTGISSVNGDFIKSDFDINQNQLPRGGLIVSLGSTPGLGYAPLLGAEVKPKLDVAGSIVSIVGIGTSIGALAKVPANSRLGIQTADYDHITGIITVTTTKVHGFSLDFPSMVKLRDLEFTCSNEHAGVTTTFFQDHERPLHLVGIISDRTFEVDAGICTIPHNYKTGGNAWEFFNDLTFGSGYYGPVAIGVTDIEFVHKFASSTNNSITANTSAQFTPTAANYDSPSGRLSLTVGSHSLQAATKHTVTDAQYDARVGIMTVTVAGHGFNNGDFVKFADNSLTFKCSMDNNATNHTYPRASDPSSNTWLQISNKTTNTFRVNVGTSPIVTFTPTGADYNPVTGLMELEIGAHSLNAGTSIRLAPNSLSFTCDTDNNSSTKTYPRSTDPLHNTAIKILSVTDTTITIQTLTTIPSTNTARHTFLSASSGAVISGGEYVHTFVGSQAAATNGLSRALNTVVIGTDSLGFTCTRDDHRGIHTYPRSTDPAAGASLGVEEINSEAIVVNVGSGGGGGTQAAISAEVAFNKHRFVSAGINSITVTGGSSLTATDADYNPQTGELVVTKASHGVSGASTITVSNAAYNENTGVLTLTKNSHGFNVGDDILITDGALTFTCTKDNNSTNHPYPRSTDYASGKWLKITNKTTNTFKVNVNPNPTSPVYGHTFVASETVAGGIQKSNASVGIQTHSIVFTCAKDAFQSLHPYPRPVAGDGDPDPAHNATLPVGLVTPNTFRLQVGKSPAGTGGALDLKITEAGGNYVNPLIQTPDPVYENLPVIGVSRLGIGKTTKTGDNLLISATVGAAQTTVGIGSTGFSIFDFKVTRSGHSFNVGDKFKPVGLVTASNLQKPIDEFELEVVETFNDFFSAWQFGEIDFIDSIKLLQNGSRRRFPLFLNGQLISFEKDSNDSLSDQIDLDAVLVIFVNGVLQTPKISYQFNGGTTVLFTEAPSVSDKVDIFFYVGQRGVDIEIVDVQETVKIGDDIQLFKNPNFVDTVDQERSRIIKSFLGSDILETDTYIGIGITEDQEKPLQWTKQKVDKIIQGEVISKSRSTIEAQIYPTAKIIGDLTISSGNGGTFGGIFVDDAESFYYEDTNNQALASGDRYGIGINGVDALVIEGDTSLIGAAFTAVVSAAGTIQSLTTSNVGSGYTAGPIHINFAAPQSVGVGVGTTAFAKATITGGKVSNVSIENVGLGYTFTAPPQVIIQQPQNLTERITSIQNVEGYTGVITGITTTNGIGGHSTALKFFYRADKTANSLLAQYPVFITDTTVGNGVTSVNSNNNSVVSIGTTFLDNIYIVNAISSSGENGEIICNVQDGSPIVGIATTGFHNPANTGLTTSLGRLSWGRLYTTGSNVIRSTTPISIGVTGFTVNSGLTTFPTVQRRNFKDTSLKGLRSTGSLRVFGLP